jgi:Transglutaminase-like superfamily
VTDGRGTVPAQTAYFLSENSYCCEFGDGAVILDLGSGAYVGIHAENLPELQIRIQNWPNSNGTSRGVLPREGATSENLIAQLLVRGILTTLPTPERPLTAISVREALPMTGPGAAQEWAPTMYMSRFVISLLIVLARHKNKKLASMLDWMRRRQSLIRRHRPVATPGDVQKLLASFLRLRIWFYTADRRCLFDSLVLATFLTKNRVPCTFMIGVSIKPFLAHSWVQVGELVLNDTAEHVQMFTPILAVGESG